MNELITFDSYEEFETYFLLMKNNGCVKKGFWKDTKNHKYFFDFLMKELNLNTFEDWYSIKQNDVFCYYGSQGLIGNHYKYSLIKALKTIYFNFNWLDWKFTQVPQNFWRNIENVKLYLNWLLNKLNKKPIELMRKDFENNYGNGLIDYYYTLKKNKENVTFEILNDCGYKINYIEYKDNFIKNISDNLKLSEEDYNNVFKKINLTSLSSYEDYQNNLSIVKYKCNKCNHIGKCKLMGLKWLDTKGFKGCKGCAKRLDPEFVENFFKVEGYELLEKYVTAKHKLKVKCIKCKNVYKTSYDNFKGGSRCPICNESKGEKEVTRILDKLNITYKREFRFNNCKDIRPLPFDFVLKINNTVKVIEYHGVQHYEPCNWGSKTLCKHENLKKQQERDKIKREWCLEKYISLLEICYKDYDKIEELIIRFLKD